MPESCATDLKHDAPAVLGVRSIR